LPHSFVLAQLSKILVPSAHLLIRSLSIDNKLGRIKCYLGEGEFTDDPLPTFGGVAVCQMPRLNELMRYLTRNGFEHHVAITHTAVADVLEEALGNYLGWEVYHHKG
jgi:L-fucose isomerase-like protein